MRDEKVFVQRGDWMYNWSSPQRARTAGACNDLRPSDGHQVYLEAADVKSIAYPHALTNIHKHTASKIGGR